MVIVVSSSGFNLVTTRQKSLHLKRKEDEIKKKMRFASALAKRIRARRRKTDGR